MGRSGLGKEHRRERTTVLLPDKTQIANWTRYAR